LFRFYKEESVVIWNGNAKKGLSTLNEFFKQLPPSKHEVIVLLLHRYYPNTLHHIGYLCWLSSHPRYCKFNSYCWWIKVNMDSRITTFYNVGVCFWDRELCHGCSTMFQPNFPSCTNCWPELPSIIC